MTPTQILDLINQYIVSNGVGGITGPILNNILAQIVNLFTTTSPNVTRLVSSSSTLDVLVTDQFIGLQRNFNLAAMSIALPYFPVGQAVKFTDLVGNLAAYPATIVPPGGQTIAGKPYYVMNEDFQSATVRYYGANVWSIET